MPIRFFAFLAADCYSVEHQQLFTVRPKCYEPNFLIASSATFCAVSN